MAKQPVWAILLCVVIGGCAGTKLPAPQTPMAPAPSPNLGGLPGNIQLASTKNAEIAGRVHQVGRQLVVASPDLRIRPNFAVIGSPALKIQHHGEATIEITEGLVAKCSTDELLAGLLGLEMAKIVAERDNREAVLLASRDREPPMETAIGAVNGGYGDPDPVRMGELKKEGFVRRRPPTNSKTADAHLMAKEILGKAGYPDAAVVAAGELLYDANRK